MTMDRQNIIDEASRLVGSELKLAYNFAQATDILLADITQRLRAFGGMKQEKKMAFANFRKAVESAAYWYERAYEGDFEACTGGDWQKLDGYRQDANELIRAMMLYIDRTTTYATYNEIMAKLKAMPEGGIFDDKMIARFEFKAKCREGGK